MAKQVRSGKPSSTVTLGKEGILHQEWRYLRDMLYTAHRNHQGQETTFPIVFALSFIYGRYWGGVCLSDKQCRRLNQPGVSPSITTAGSEEQQGRPKARGDALNRHVLCCATSPVAKGAAPAGISLPLEWHSSASWQGGTQSDRKSVV